MQRPFNWSPALGQERACYTAGQKQLAQIGTRTRKHLAQTSREHLQWYFRSRRPFDVSAEKVGIYREEELSTSLSLPQSSHGRRLLFVSGSPPAKPTPPYLPRATRVGELREGGIGVGVPIELPPSRPTVFTLPPSPRYLVWRAFQASDGDYATQILPESTSIIEHTGHVPHTRNIPITDGLIERAGVREHIAHARHP